MPPLCFILMPRGRRKLLSGVEVDFDALHDEIVRPAVEFAGLEAVRAEATDAAGAMTPPVFESLMLCDVVVAETASADAATLYALGWRRGLRPGTTVLLGAHAGSPDAAALPGLLAETLFCGIGADGRPTQISRCRARLTARLAHVPGPRDAPAPDLAVLRLAGDARTAQIARLKTDVFRDQSRYDADARQRLAAAREAGPEALRRVATELGEPARLEAGVAVDLLLSWRALGDAQAMVDLAAGMEAPLARSRMVREQLGFALNRLGRRDEAEAVLQAVVAEYDPSSETNGLLGRVYKDRWDGASTAGEPGAERWLQRAIDAYLQGFEADWRDAYPGINAVTLMELRAPPDPRRGELLPVVTYAVRRRLAGTTPDYWDHATLLELAVLRRDEGEAGNACAHALGALREGWEARATARNLRLIREARVRRGESPDWAKPLEDALLEAASRRDRG